jgi:O6-methylguanine-DNA--protein-cysteine methyltransferase
MGVLQKLHQHSDRYFRMHVVLARGGALANQQHREIVRRGSRARRKSGASPAARAHSRGLDRPWSSFSRKSARRAETGHGMTALSSYQRIYAAVRRIPPGRVSTYGAIARVAGLAGQARQVGYALSALPTGTERPVAFA